MSFFSNLLDELESKTPTDQPGPIVRSAPRPANGGISAGRSSSVRTGSSSTNNYNNGSSARPSGGTDSGGFTGRNGSTNDSRRDESLGRVNGTSRPRPTADEPGHGTAAKRKSSDDGMEESRLTKSPKVGRFRPEGPPTKVPSLAMLARLTSTRPSRSVEPDGVKSGPLVGVKTALVGNGAAGSKPTDAAVGAAGSKGKTTMGKPIAVSALGAGAKPAKGSYLEILARAEAAKANAPAVGIITNKRHEVKRAGVKTGARPALEFAAGGKNRGGKKGVPVHPGRRLNSVTTATAAPSRTTIGGAAVDPDAERKAKILSYKGTMGLGRPVSDGSGRQGGVVNDRNGGHRSNGRALGGRRESEDEERYYEDDGYSSDDSAMEVSAFELEREEKHSLREAIKDDLEEERRELEREKQRGRS